MGKSMRRTIPQVQPACTCSIHEPEDYESDPVFGQSAASVGCAVTAGKIQAALYWATGREYEVRETQCKAQGAPACCFEIGAPLI